MMKLKIFLLLSILFFYFQISYSQCLKKDIKGANFGYIEEQDIFGYTYITLNNSVLYIVDSTQQLYYECIVKNDSIEIPSCFVDDRVKLILIYNGNIYSTVTFWLDKFHLDYEWILCDIYPDLYREPYRFRLNFSKFYTGDIYYNNPSEYHLYSENVLKEVKDLYTLINPCNND